jgi:phosphopantetheinyl transferase
MIYLGVVDVRGKRLEKSLLEAFEKSFPEEYGRITGRKNEKSKLESIAARLLIKKIYEAAFGEEMPSICYTDKGKPFFSGGKTVFSISHSNGIVAVALTKDEENIGIDVQEFPKNENVANRAEKRFLSVIKRRDLLFCRGEAEDFFANEKKEVFVSENQEMLADEQKEMLASEQKEVCEKASACRNEASGKDNPFVDMGVRFFNLTDCGVEPARENIGIALLSTLEEPYVIKENSFKEGSDFLKTWTSLEALVKLSGEGLSKTSDVNETLQKSNLKTLFLQHGSCEWALSVAVFKN